MFSFAPFINHVLTQQTWAQACLRAHARKIVCIDLEAVQFNFQIGVDGLLQAVAADTPHAVKLSLKWADLPRILSQPERAFAYVKIQGDADLAECVSSLAQQLRWDAEADLSRVIGEIAAVRSVALAKNVLAHFQRSSLSVQASLAEYFLEENPMLLRPRQTAHFSVQVNQIRDDVERLEKRIARLERSRG